MKLHPNRPSVLNTITAYGPGFIEVNAQRIEHALLLMPEQPIAAWAPASFEDLVAAHFDAVLAAEPEVVLLGTGARQRFAHPRLTAALIARRIGVESMDTGAACRTYNILMTEGRKVMAALLPV
jgi:uncharacterized protein